MLAVVVPVYTARNTAVVLKMVIQGKQYIYAL